MVENPLGLTQEEWERLVSLLWGRFHERCTKDQVDLQGIIARMHAMERAGVLDPRTHSFSPTWVNEAFRMLPPGPGDMPQAPDVDPPIHRQRIDWSMKYLDRVVHVALQASGFEW